MQVNVKVQGIDATIAHLGKHAKQIPFATARALTVTAHAVNAEVKRDLASKVQGGATPYTLRAFKVTSATVATQASSVSMRTDSPEGGTPYDKAIAHLFHGGLRRFKRLEGLLSSRGLLPSGMQIVPGAKLPMDKRGNPRLPALKEMLGILASTIRNLHTFRRSGKSKQSKAIGFFVVLPGSTAARHLHLGIWRRIETGSQSVIEPWFMFVRPGGYRQRFDLKRIAESVIAKTWNATFNDSLAKALATAR
jgi:hypothetical protein